MTEVYTNLDRANNESLDYSVGKFDENVPAMKSTYIRPRATRESADEIYTLKLEIGRLTDELEKSRNESKNYQSDLKQARIALRSSVSREKMEIDALKEDLFLRDKKIASLERKLNTAEHNLISRNKAYEELQYKFILAFNKDSPAEIINEVNSTRIAEIEKQKQDINEETDLYAELFEAAKKRCEEYQKELENSLQDYAELERKYKMVAEALIRYEKAVEEIEN